jgi:hypothetical protein
MALSLWSRQQVDAAACALCGQSDRRREPALFPEKQSRSWQNFLSPQESERLVPPGTDRLAQPP